MTNEAKTGKNTEPTSFARVKKLFGDYIGHRGGIPGARYASPNAFAAAHKINANKIYEFIDGKRDPRGSELFRWFEYLHDPLIAKSMNMSEEFKLIPVMAMFSSKMVNIRNIDDLEIEHTTVMSRSWVSKIAKTPILLEVFGRDMEPEFPEKSMVLIDMSDLKVLPGRVYAILHKGLTRVLRAIPANGGLIFGTGRKDERVSDFTQNEPRFPYPPRGEGENGGDYTIVGRVVWTAREV